MNNKNNNPFIFSISLSVLNHLGRKLYRNFITVLGEAISNAWDADAKNVWIYIEKEKGNFVVKDDGVGMSENDFRNKFLKIGYSKRAVGGGKSKSDNGRPYIGRKGIGKLALLSCANKISVISKIENREYVGGVIDNDGLDEAIKYEIEAEKYSLEDIDYSVFSSYQDSHKHGTIIHFEKFNNGIKNTFSFLRKLLALNFRFSLLDSSFNIFFQEKKIDENDLNELSEKTQFFWEINNYSEKYKERIKTFTKENKKISFKNRNVNGFVASVAKPADLKILNINERVSIDLFVNGRLREKDILKHNPSARIVENYLYGEIHFDELDQDGEDRFTTNRESIIGDDPKYKEFLENINKEVFTKIINDWDKLRRKYKKDGDPDNPNVKTKERKAIELFNIISDEYFPEEKSITGFWINELEKDAKTNFVSYGECFVSENLLRKYIKRKNIDLSSAKKEINHFKKQEENNKKNVDMIINIREKSDDLNYLKMDSLVCLIENNSSEKKDSLSRYAKQYKPIRDALAHTSLLTKEAKRELSIVYFNLKKKLKKLFSFENSKN